MGRDPIRLRRRREDALCTQKRAVPCRAVPLGDNDIFEFDRFKARGFIFDQHSPVAHGRWAWLRASRIVDGVETLPVKKAAGTHGVTAEALAKRVDTMAGGIYKYASLVWSCEAKGMRTDTADLQRRSNAVVRQASWCTSLLQEQMFKSSKHGGFGCIQFDKSGKQQRIASAVRILNSSSLTADVLRLEIAFVATRARYPDGHDDAGRDGHGRWLSLDALMSRVKDDPFTNNRPLLDFRKWRGSNTFMNPSMSAVRILQDLRSVGVLAAITTQGAPSCLV